jgi:hypothetical protein
MKNLSALNILGNYVLLLLFERGVKPTPQAVVENANAVSDVV